MTFLSRCQWIVGQTLSLVLLLLMSPVQASDDREAGSPNGQPPFELVPATSLMTYPKGYFLENIVIDGDGTLYITENLTGQVLQRTPDGAGDTFAQVGINLAGLVLDIDGDLLATGHVETGENYIIEFREDGTPAYELEVAGAGFLNGMTLFRPGEFLIADSQAGLLWRFDRSTREVTPWVEDPHLDPNPNQPTIPGANGVKVFDGDVYVTNSGQAKVIRIPVDPDGSAGPATVWFEGLVLDDFAFSAAGNLYGTTHIFDSVVKITPEGEAVTLATADQGVTGSTALVFGVTESDQRSVFVVGDGGIFGAESEADIIAPELVRLDVGESGYIPE